MPPRLSHASPRTAARRAARRCWPPSPPEAEHLVEPDAAHVPRPRTGSRCPGWLFRPRGALGPLPTLHVAARRPGGPGAPGLPAAVPGAVRRGVAVFAPERARLRRLRAQLRRGRRPRPPVRRDHRRARRGDVPRGVGAGRPARSAWRAARTAATSRWPRWPGSRSCSPSASTCAGSPTSPRSTPRPSRGSRRRPPRSTATRTTDADAAARAVPDPPAPTGSPRRCWSCTGRTTRTCRSWRRSRSSRRCASAARSPGFLLFDDEGHEVHGTENRARFVREVVRWVHRAPAGRGRADGLSRGLRSVAERLDDLPAVLRCRSTNR